MKLQNKINELAEVMNEADILMNICAVSEITSDTIKSVIESKTKSTDEIKRMLFDMAVVDLNIRMFRQKFPQFSEEMNRAISHTIDCYRAEFKDEPKPEDPEECIEEMIKFFNDKGFDVKVTKIKASK